MSNYRRLYIDGGTYFFTLVTHNRKPLLCLDNSLLRLKSAFQYTNKKHPFTLKGLVILPDHLHCILELPQGDHEFSIRWTMIKRFFSIAANSDVNARREKQIWQKRYWKHWIRDEADYERCLNYIYYNPVKHGYAESPIDWSHGTFRRDVRQGLYDSNWGSNTMPNRSKDLDWE